MYSILYIMFVEGGVDTELDNKVLRNKQRSRVTREEEEFGLPSEYEYTHPDYVLFVDEVSDNTHTKDDGPLGGEKRLWERSGIAKQRYSIADTRWTTLGFTAATGEPVICVIIIKAKELNATDTLGIDIFQTYDENKSIAENTGMGKKFPGGPICHFRGKDVKYLVFSSEGGGINSVRLNQCFDYMDKLQIFDCTIAKSVVVCDGHESRLGLEFMKYIVAEDTRWYVGLGGPNGTSKWKLGDSSEKNGCFNMWNA